MPVIVEPLFPTPSSDTDVCFLSLIFPFGKMVTWYVTFPELQMTTTGQLALVQQLQKGLLLGKFLERDDFNIFYMSQ